MNNKIIKFLNRLIIIAVLGSWIMLFIGYKIELNKNARSDITIKLHQPEFFLKSVPDSVSLMDALIFYEIQEPEIVFAQAVLETGYFKSPVMNEYNNLFGLYNSKTNKYIRFNHWAYSVAGYKDYIQYKRKSEEPYYKFLKRIGYAEDAEYINKIKYLVKNEYVWDN